MSNESEPLRVLVIDDDTDVVQAARLYLERSGIKVQSAGHPDDAWPVLTAETFDVILLDLNFTRGRTSGEEGFAMLDRLIATDPYAAIVVITGHSGIAIAVEAMRAGASDVVIKPWNNERLLATVTAAAALRRAKLSSANIDRQREEDRVFIGEHPAITAARTTIGRVAPTAASALIVGPPGCGKSLAARAIVRASSLLDKPVETIMAATVTSSEKLGEILARARDGTLLIEEPTLLAPDLQAILARGLDNIRVIAMSRATLGKLRDTLWDELLYAISTVQISLPALAERGDDILLLSRHFLKAFSAKHGLPPRELSEEAARAIAADNWPNGVRELKQAMERAVILAKGERYEVADFVLAMDHDDPQPRAITNDLHLERNERKLVEAALKRHAFNVSRAAADLGLTRAALYRRMEKHDL